MPKVNRKAESDLPRERLYELLHYDSYSGEFTWLKNASNRAPKGSKAGSYYDDKCGHRYVFLSVDRHLFLAHRVAWFYMTGAWPIEQIDHVDGDGWNNRFSNLRLASNPENMRNVRIRTDNTTGVKGVTFNARYKNPYLVWLNGNYLGCCATLKEATTVRELAARKSHGQFYREA